MVFPGQGSQSVGMQADFADRYPVVAETYSRAGEVLGYDLFDLVANGPEEKLNQTEVTQPAMLTADVSTWRAWQATDGPLPAIMAGHSLGEYAALVCSGAMAFEVALDLVRNRARYMQEAVPAGNGAMAAILGLDDRQIQEVCENASRIGIAEAVNFNSPGQVVVAGHKKAIDRLIELAREAGARRAILLPVSVPSHSTLMRPAGERLGAEIDACDIRTPAVPVVCAVDGTPYGDAEDIRTRLKAQVYNPVRWVDTVQYMTGAGAKKIIECGPGKVLGGLLRRIDKSLTVACLDSSAALQAAQEGASE